MAAFGLTIFVVDSDSMARVSTAALVSSMGLPCETFSSAEQFFEEVDPSQPGCVVVDLQLEGMDAFQFREHLLDSGILLPIIFVGVYVTVEDAVRAMRAGAISVLEKPYNADELAEAICAAATINRNAHAANRYGEALRTRFENMDSRERDVMTLIVTGVPNKTIARELGVCQRTAAQIRATVFEKMGAESAVDLAMMASRLWRHGPEGTLDYANVAS